MDERPDLSAILHSPLDDPDPPAEWPPLIGGILVGGLVVIGGYLAASGNSEQAAPAMTTTSQVAPPTTAVVVEAGDEAFPPGFAALTDVVGGKPVYAIQFDDELVVSVATATRRGFENDGSFDGGEWVLETVAGETAESSAVVFDAFLDGAFSVVFPVEAGSGLRALRLVERWAANPRSGSATVEPAAVPGAVPDVTVELGGGAAIRFSEIDLSESGGSLSWELTGATTSEVDVVLRAVRGDVDLAVYSSTGDVRFFPTVPRLERLTEGRINLERNQGSGSDPGETTALVFDVDVTLVVALPATAEWDVAGLPVVTP